MTTHQKPKVGDHPCYSDDWTRTNPDLAIYLPEQPPYAAEASDHVLVEVTSGGDLLAIWTYATRENVSDNSVMYARSSDDGRTWTAPTPIAAPQQPGTYCNFGWPVISRAGRIYVFYNFAKGVGEGFINAVMRCSYSDDDGCTWVDAGIDIPYRRNDKYDHPDPSLDSRCIVWQKPIRDAKDRPVAGLTRCTAAYVKPTSKENGLAECRCEFIRYDNIDEGPEPQDLEITFLPDDEDLVSVPATFEPEQSMGITFCQEPGLVLLPDGRLFAAMRTANGQVWYSVSDDDGHTFGPSEILRFRDGGEPLLNPVAPTPMFRMGDGRFLLFIQNHDGYGYGGRGPLDLNSPPTAVLRRRRIPPECPSTSLVQPAENDLRHPVHRRLSPLHEVAVDVRQLHRTQRQTHLLVRRPKNLRPRPLHHRRAIGGYDRTRIGLAGTLMAQSQSYATIGRDRMAGRILNPSEAPHRRPHPHGRVRKEDCRPVPSTSSSPIRAHCTPSPTPGATAIGQKFGINIAYHAEADVKSWAEFDAFLGANIRK